MRPSRPDGPPPPRPSARSTGLLVGAALFLAAGSASADPTPLQQPLAWNYGELETPRSMGLGGALRALGGGSSAVLLNPAELATSRAYHIEAFGQFTPEASRHVWGGVVMDSITGKLAGGTGVFGSFVDENGIKRQGVDVRLALAYPIADRVFIGLTGRYIRMAQDGVGPFGESRASGGGLKEDGSRNALLETVTFDAGASVKIVDNLYLAALGTNLTFQGGGIIPSSVGGGIGYGNKDFSIEADGLADFHSWGTPTARVMAGGEYLIANHVPVRLGYRYDQGADMHFLSAGLGYVAKEFSVEASVRRGLAEIAPTSFVIGVAYYLESSGLISPQQPQPQTLNAAQ